MNILVSTENLKVGNDTIIINRCSGIDCPSFKLGKCQMLKLAKKYGIKFKCYAQKAEKFRPAVLSFRRRQEVIWDAMSADEIADQLIGMITRRRKNKVDYIRFSESGDMRNNDDVKKVNDIAKKVYDTCKVISYIYTARDDLKWPTAKHVIVNGSAFMVDNNFKAVLKDYVLKANEIECKGNCRVCNYCKTKGKKTIVNRIH